MTNHYHIVVETPEANLSKGMRQLNGVYTQASNHRHGLVGHLFQGRFKAILVERDAYLLELARYVVLNPVRAATVSQAGDWPWSSYRAMVGAEPAPVWLEIDWVLGQIGEERAQARAGLRCLRSPGSRATQRLGRSALSGLSWQRAVCATSLCRRHDPGAPTRSAARPAPATRQAPGGLRAPLTRPGRGHGPGLSDRCLLHAGNCRCVRRTLLHRQSSGATTGRWQGAAG